MRPKSFVLEEDCILLLQLVGKRIALKRFIFLPG